MRQQLTCHDNHGFIKLPAVSNTPDNAPYRNYIVWIAFMLHSKLAMNKPIVCSE